VWSSLRVVYWMSTDNQYTCVSEVIHGLPYALQFSTFSLVLFFLINVMYGGRWQQRVRLFQPKVQEPSMRMTAGQNTYGTSQIPSYDAFPENYLHEDEEDLSLDTYRYTDESERVPPIVQQALCCMLPCQSGICYDWKIRIRTFHVILCIGINVVMTVVVLCLTIARCEDVIHISYPEFDRYMTLAIFSFLLMCWCMYGLQFIRQTHEPHHRTEHMRGKIAKLVIFIILICISRCLYAVLYPWFPKGFPDMEIMDNGAKHPQGYLVCAEIMWEILPAAAVFVFFRGVPKTPYPRSLFRWWQQRKQRKHSFEPPSPPLGPNQDLTARFQHHVGPAAGYSVGSSAVGGMGGISGMYNPYTSSYSQYVQGSLTASGHYRTIFDDPHRYESEPPDIGHHNILHAPPGTSSIVGSGVVGGIGSNVGMPTFDLLDTPLVYSSAPIVLPSLRETSGNPREGSTSASRDADADLFPG